MDTYSFGGAEHEHPEPSTKWWVAATLSTMLFLVMFILMASKTSEASGGVIAITAIIGVIAAGTTGYIYTAHRAHVRDRRAKYHATIHHNKVHASG